MELLEVLDSVRAEAGKATGSFAKNGHGGTSLATLADVKLGDGGGAEHDLMKASEASPERLTQGFTGWGRRRKANPQYMRALGEVAALVEGVQKGDRLARYVLQEVLSTSDFPSLFGDIIDRMLLGNYLETPATYPDYAKQETVPDFRTVKRFFLDGAEGELLKVAEGTEYPQGKVTDGKYEYAVEKYGRGIPFTFEAIINDDLGAFNDIIQRLGRAARRTEERFVTGLFVDSTGPDSTFFSNGNLNIVNTTVYAGASDDNPPLSVQGLMDAIAVIRQMKDTDGEPIIIDELQLVVPPGLEVTANNILSATQLWVNAAGGTSDQRLITQNWVKNVVKGLSVNYYLPIIDTTSGNTAWYLFARPRPGSRPAVMFGKLRGHETPETFMKSPNAVRVGGGDVNPLDGDFDTDSVRYKVRTIHGGTLGDPKMAVVSNGTGA